MKFNSKRTVLVGFAFLSICAFWQLYDGVVPLILKKTFHMREDVAGVIMALDNVLALFMLPFFGRLSDRCHTRIGKRMPFLLGGTAVAVVAMNLLPYADNRGSLTVFVVALGVLLIAMGTYRSPAVALMPDVTPKPFRSKGNAVINLMGSLGGVFTLAMTSLLVRVGATGRNDYTMLFVAVSLLMAVSVAVVFCCIKENQLTREVAALEEAEQPAETEASSKGASGFSSLEPEVRRSLLLILGSVFFWYMGYNAVTTAFTKYVDVQWHYGIQPASLCLMVGTVGAVVSYLPVGILSSRFGRKRVIQAGVLLLAACFGAAGVFSTFHPAVYILFALIGVAWAMINVNSYPMVVEITKSADIGKFTGYYYTFSMAAQIMTPILSGVLLQNVGYYTLMPYATGMVLLSFVTISMTKHGDSRPEPPKSKLETFDVGDD